MKQAHVELTEVDEQKLIELTQKGELKARVYKRAIGLLELHRGKTYIDVSETLDVNHNTVSVWAKNYASDGIQSIYDKPRSGRPRTILNEQKAKIIALACSDPPTGYARWTYRLLADKAVALEYVDEISHSEIANILKKTNFSHTER